MIQHAMVQQLIAQTQPALQANGIGKGLTSLIKEDMTEIVLPIEAYNNFVYNDVQIFANQENYVVVKDQSVLYFGMVDAEGVNATIINDIESTPEFMNIMICIANEDESKILELLENPNFLSKYLTQMQMGYQKGHSNGHY